MNLLRRLDQEQCIRCGKAGHSSEDCPSFDQSIAYACCLLGVALISLIGVAAVCADAFAFPAFGSFK